LSVNAELEKLILENCGGMGQQIFYPGRGAVLITQSFFRKLFSISSFSTWVWKNLI
jgi:hypothetical protein